MLDNFCCNERRCYTLIKYLKNHGTITIILSTGFSGGISSYALTQAEEEKFKRASSVTMFNIDDKDTEKTLEYFFASDARYMYIIMIRDPKYCMTHGDWCCKAVSSNFLLSTLGNNLFD